ncbi:zinc ABC transporter substrate-binding protein [candidate division KSB1 bacterium]|nr:zinc ABC transporter substrate-binding protein [candidate division KSB1 bacterium]
MRDVCLPMMWSMMALFLIVNPGLAAPLRIVASTNDLAAVAREIAGESATVKSVCAAAQDPHAVELQPAHVLAVKDAAVYLKVGMELDGWADDLISASGNRSIRVIDCSNGIVPLDGGARDVHGHGDHPAGNPHYWLGPTNLVAVARNIADGLSQVNRYGASTYGANLERFERRLTDSLAVWKLDLSACGAPAVLVYHATWDYLARDFGWTIAAAVEPRPGVEPSPAEIAAIQNVIRDQQVRWCLVEPYTHSAILDMLRQDSGVKTIALPASVGDYAAMDNNFGLFRSIVNLLSANCR